jgi:two-component system, sensor histidine kinase and response regulator
MKGISHGDTLKERDLLAAILDTAGMLVVVLDPEGRVLHFNQACRELSGYSAEEAQGRPLWELMVPEEHRAWAAAIHAQVLAGEVPAPGDSPWVVRDGSAHTVKWRVSTLRGDDGSVEHVILAGTDVTDVRRDQEALAESEARFRGVVDNIGIGVTVLDSDLRVLAANRQMREWYPALDPGQHPVCYEAFNDPPRETPCDYCPVMPTFADGMTHSALTETPVGDEVMNYRISASPLRDAEGRVTAVIETVEDVTTQQRWDRALQASEQRFRDVASSSADIIWETDTEGRFTYCSGRSQEILGYAPAEMVGMTPFEMMPLEEAARVYQIFQELIPHRRPVVDLENWSVARDGRQVCLLTNGVPRYDKRGEFAGYRGTDRDITARKEAEDALRRSEAKFRALYDSTSDAVMLLDDAGAFDCNEATLRMFGCASREEFHARHPAAHSPLQQPCGTASSVLSKELAATALAEGSNRFDWVHQRQDTGEVFPAEVLLSAVELDGKRVLQAVVRDITERRAAEDLLRESESQYRLLFGGLMESFAVHEIILDEQGEPVDYVFLEVNDAFEEQTGLRREQVLGHRASEIIPGLRDGDFDWVAVYGEVALTGRPIQFEQHSAALDRWYDVSAYCPRRGHFATLFSDITDRKSREAQLRGLQAISPRLVGATDLGEVLEQVVESARSLVGAELAVIVLVDPETGGIGAAYHSNFPTESIPPGTQPIGQGLLGMILSGHELLSGDVSAHPGFVGLPAWHPVIRSCIGVPLTARGRVTAMLLVADLTADKFSEDDRLLVRALADLAAAAIENSRLMAQLREANLLQYAILDTAATAVVTLDTERRITSVNGAFTEITGYADDDVLGQSCHALEVEPCPQTSGLLELGKERVQGAECMLRHKDGRRLNIRKNARIMRDGEGAVTGAIESFVDVTDLVGARQAALDGSEAKSSFLARMSHEIRTPMNGVIGMLALALDTPLNDEQRDFLTTASTSADALLALLNDILDFSKIEAGQLKLEQRVFDLGAVLENAVTVVAAEASRKALELPVFVDPALPQYVVGDSHRLRQVIVNLLSNAVKFTESGEVEARAELASLDGFALRVRVSVRDTGIGIEEEAQARVFDVFEQADGSTTRKHGGSGLGLAICRQLVEMMGGKMDLRSKAGQGSTFSFVLPLEVAREEDAPQPVSVEELRGMPVLIVDDNTTNRRILMEYLKSWGCKPRQAPNASEALERLRLAAEDSPYGLAIVDAQMPGLSGFDLTRLVRTDPRLKDTTVLMLSSLGPGVTQEALDAGAAGYVLKPIKRSDLFDAIAVALGYRERHDAAAASATVAPGRGLRVLVAEDNPVNQKVAVRVLTRAGHAAQTAATGLQAIEALRSGAFDVVLMDVQMPEMDGLEATRRLRQEPCFANLPIIALTAHALDGDRERCLEAGMDDYLPKPFTAEQLLSALEKWTRGHAEAAPEEVGEPAEVTAAGDAAPLDMAVLTEAVGDDEAFALSLLGDMVESGQALVEQAAAASEAGDLEGLSRAAHSLKGSAGAVGAEGLREAAASLEQLARAADVAAAGEALPAVRRELLQLQEWVGKLTAASVVS